MGLHLGDDLAKNLPAERVYETDGVSSVRPLLLIFHAKAMKQASSRAGNDMSILLTCQHFDPPSDLLCRWLRSRVALGHGVIPHLSGFTLTAARSSVPAR